jgi:tetratricopeptide (TPR) repeat protein
MRRILCVLAGITMVMAMCAQARPQAASPVWTNPANAKTEGPEAMSGVGKDANLYTLDENQHGSVFFMGKVLVEDAPMPWDPIPVVVTCNGVVKYRTVTDAKGSFTIQPSYTGPMHSEIAPTVASQRQASAAQLIGCDIHGALPGFKSSSLHIANTSIMDDPDLGRVVLTPDRAAAGSTMSATYATASPDAVKQFDKARAEFQNGKAGSAEHDLEKAVKTDPKFADAWYELGKMQQAQKPADALNSYEKAVAADPKFISPYLPMAELAADQKKWQEVTNATDAALKLDPEGSPQLWYYNAVGNFNLGKVDVAEAAANKSLAMDPQHLAPNTEQLLAVMLASQGQLAEALQHLKNSLTYVKAGPNRDLIQQQIAQLEKAMPAGSN